MNEELTLKEKALEAISEYLKSTGWQQIEPRVGWESAWFQWIDPLTGTSHRSDFAFVIQTDRELSKKLFDTSS
jgi:hypothetical protein